MTTTEPAAAGPQPKTLQIKHRYTGAVLFECAAESGMTMRHVLERAVASGANLSRSDLSGSNLSYSNLSGSDLRGSDLRGSDLSGSDLRRSDLSYSNLSGSDLRGSDLRGSDLRGSNLSGKKLIGNRPFLSIGPIGSRSDYLQAFITDGGLMLRVGCFFGNRDEFESAVTETHGDNVHAVEYRAALTLIDKHAELWTPAKEPAPQNVEKEAA